ncbi:54S ribosomal protein L8, mitochondrial [Lithohypha guttulata]|uniref:54S ribosomal protein L8, mitochondrial n=1 Tax=Lithohypha guttulata TaxID=1690604 RepID=UPI002DDDE947|nr:54S ribosomal protein L8, mitochondrial [Lithohypha guttulata]
MPASSQYRRPLGRDSAHRQSLLRNLVTSLIKHEQISTTYAKAKEAQRVAEKLITLGKKNTNASRLSARGFFHEPDLYLPKVFGELAKRYESRPGGYTRVLPFDGPKDVRFKMTAKALSRQQDEMLPMNEITATNIRKVTRFRANGATELLKEVGRIQKEKASQETKEKKMFEKDGTRFKWTSDLPRNDPRWIEKRGPGRLVRRKIGPDDEEDVDAKE